MAKRVLTETWIYLGKHYGPGEVELPHEVDKALKAKGAFEGDTGVTESTPALKEHLAGEVPPQGRFEIPRTPERPPAEGEQGDSRLSLVPPARVPDPALIRRLGSDLAEQLALAGFNSEASVRAASDEAILSLDGIGPATLRKIRMATEG